MLAIRGESSLVTHKSLIPDAIARKMESFVVPDVLSALGNEQYKHAKEALDEVIQRAETQLEFRESLNIFIRVNMH